MSDLLIPENQEQKKVKMTIDSIEKLDNNFIHIIGKINFKEINVITNGKFTLDVRNFFTIKEIINYKGFYYVIARKCYEGYYLICINDKKRLIKNVEYISYLNDGLLEINLKKVFDLNSNDYVPFPENMEFKNYKDNIISLQNKSEIGKENRQMVIDREGKTIIPLVSGDIDIIDSTKFIIKNNLTAKESIVDFNQQTIYFESDFIGLIGNDKLAILNKGKLSILNYNLEIINTYEIGEEKRPWCVIYNNEFISMTFKTEDKKDLKEESNITIIVDFQTNNVFKVDYIPKLSDKNIIPITDKNCLKGLLNRKTGEIIVKECQKVDPLNDSKCKYFYIKKDDKNFIYDAERKNWNKVTYTDMKPFKNGLAIGINNNPINYEIIDEDFNILFKLDHMGSFNFEYENGILCYHSGNWAKKYDAYTIINKNNEVLMPKKECKVKKNNFGLLEIKDKETGETTFFDFQNEQFLKLQLDVPIIKNGIAEELNFNKITSNDIINQNLIKDNYFKVKKISNKHK